MWIDSDGTAHTVALPDPTDVMSGEFRVSLDALMEADRDALQAVIEEAEERVFDADLSGLSRSESFIAAAPPVGLLRGHVAVPADLANMIDTVDLRWRLDVILALDDYLD